MNAFKLAAGVIGGLLVASLVTLALLPSQMEVSRSAVIRADPGTVSTWVSRFPKRLQWVAWTEIDPDATYTFGGVPGTPGSTMAWVGQEIGTAELTLDSLVPGHEVQTTLVYEAPFSMTSTDRFTFEPVPDGTRVTWTARAPLAFGPERVFGVFADSIIGPDYERGLERLDELLAASSSTND